jgi:hypothetical protein
MSRSRAQSGPTISLFPFLAVLLCMMGALLVLLVLFSRSAKKADTAAADEARRLAEAQVREELVAARDEAAWRIEQLEAVRARTTGDLARARMQLAGTEEDARRLADEFENLERTAAALAGATAGTVDEQAILELERRLAEAKKALDAAKEGAESKPPAYAVVPYEGRNGTHRRPLYIECCIDGVFLQPEGIRLGPADFEGPPGPGNPLASALRAAREHLARSPGESGDPNAQPYPLLLVRPSGVMAYYAARESIGSWGSEFGYQFIDEEWEITYPPRDPTLAEVEMRAVEEARRRLEWLAQVRPVKTTKPATTYRAATTRGGVVTNGGPSVLGDQSRFEWTEQQANRGVAGRGFNAAGSGNDAAGVAGGEAGGDAILGDRNGRGGTASGAGVHGGGPSGSGPGGPIGDGPGGGDANLVGSRYAGPSKFYSGQAGGAGSSAAGAEGTGPLASGAGTGHAGGEAGEGSSSPAGRPDGGATGAAGGPNGALAAAGASSGGSGGTGGGASSGSPTGSASGGGGAAGGPSMPGLHQQGGGSSVSATGASGGASASLAGKRGSNWASLATQDRPVPLTRPIRLECAADEFRILGERGRVESRIPVGTHTIDSVDLLVREVHATVGRWGLAGDRMYWKPELVLSATPDGAARRAELEQLLADSGIDTRRSENAGKIRDLPPVQRTGGIFPRR